MAKIMRSIAPVAVMSPMAARVSPPVSPPVARVSPPVARVSPPVARVSPPVARVASKARVSKRELSSLVGDLTLERGQRRSTRQLK